MASETRPWADEDDEMDTWGDEVVLTPEDMQAMLQTRLILEGHPEDDYIETARQEADSWWVQEWERYDMSGQPYWRAASGYRIDKSVVTRLAAAQQAREESR